MRLSKTLIATFLVGVSIVFLPAVWGELHWWDGTIDAADRPPGKLLTENAGYWGEQVLTGVEYTYETPPDNPADRWRNTEEFGRRLLDGRVAGNWWVPVGTSGRPLVVTFDFQRRCQFAEVDVAATRSKKVGITLECRATEGQQWTTVYDRPAQDCPEEAFHRIKLPGQPAGRYLRVTMQKPGIVYVDEILVWGEAEVTADNPEVIKPIGPRPGPSDITFCSIPGIEKTVFSDAQYWDWRRAVSSKARHQAVWSRVPTWDSISSQPLLPDADQIISKANLVMARNETESMALALTNTADQPIEVELVVSEFRRVADRSAAPGIRADLRVAAAIPSRHYGVVLGPLFAADNLLDDGLMRRYLTNGAGIKDFPHVTLSPAGSAVFWLSVTTDGVPPGLYEARLAYRNGAPVIIEVEVVDVALPSPFVWLNTWSGTTGMFPLKYADRTQREVAYKQSLGVTVWGGFPTPDSPAALAHAQGTTIHQIWGLPGDYGHRLYAGQIEPEDLTAEDARIIAEHTQSLVNQAQDLGLSYDDWYLELTDEPGYGNSPAYGALARLIKQADPRVNIYANPCFWVGGGVMEDEKVYEVLSPWYGQYVDVSVPLFLLLRDRPQSYRLFDVPRLVNAFYYVATHHAKSENAPQVELYRRMAWDAFKRGWNGWGFYSYFAPRGNPWDDSDTDWYTTEDRPDYQMVYPGPRGPIASRPSEAVREGWEDYRLLTLLQQRGLDEQLAAILEAYAADQLLEQLRLCALKAAAGQD